MRSQLGREPNGDSLSVLHVSQSVEYGLKRYLTELVTAQADRGWTVALATSPDPELRSRCAALGVEVHHWSARRSPGPSVAAELWSLRRVIAAVRPDVVHLHSSKAGLVGRLAMRGRRPTIFSPHAWSFLHAGTLMQRASLAWERLGARWVDVILCVSEAERTRGLGAGIDATYRVVPNAVDLERFPAARTPDRAAARARLGLGAGPLAVCVGRLVAQKGQDLLVSAWEDVRKRLPEAKVALVGDGELRDALEGAGVLLVGHSDDVRSWLLAADVVVQPSRWEGMSLLVLEAIASGRSVVVTDVEGMREAVGEGPEAAGAVVPLDDQVALVSAIVERLENPAVRDREEQRAAERRSDFGLAAWGEAIAAITSEVAAERAAPR